MTKDKSNWSEVRPRFSRTLIRCWKMESFVTVVDNRYALAIVFSTLYAPQTYSLCFQIFRFVIGFRYDP